MPYKSGVDRTRIVVPPGPPGAPDCARVIYYGTVLRVGDELWMWYLAQGDDDRWLQRVCLATSRDGYQWHKPELGLVEYHGSKANNLVDLLGGEHNITVLVVVHEPDDPDPARRFKAVFQTKRYTPQFAVAFSADGGRWHEPERRPDLPGCEMAGVTRFNGCYYVSAHGGSHFGSLRQLVTFVSYDFEHWQQASCIGLRREHLPPRPMVYGPHQGRAGAPGRRPVESRQRDHRPLRAVARTRQRRPPPRHHGSRSGGEQRRPGRRGRLLSSTGRIEA